MKPGKNLIESNNYRPILFYFLLTSSKKMINDRLTRDHIQLVHADFNEIYLRDSDKKKSLTDIFLSDIVHVEGMKGGVKLATKGRD